jgi:hypothetical protein
MLLAISPSLLADGGAQHQVQTNNYGVSGGNINDISKLYCCSGTLGSLVKDNNNVLYILSNNHVLAESDQGSVGDDVSQPGLIENGCRVPRIVADLSAWSPLGSNVDAAIAELRSGTMNTNGAIEDIGIPCSAITTATVGMSVTKSGRTTGTTTGSVSSVNTSVNVQYQKSCGMGKKFTVSYTGQVVITPGTFSAGGDSGSLIVTSSNHSPIGLLFAGSSSSTIANPIGQVLTKLNTALGGGRTLSFVGGACTASTSPTTSAVANNGPSRDAIDFATSAMRTREKEIMGKGGVIGMGIGSSDDNAGEAIIVVYIDATSGAAPSLPRRINGVRVKRVFTEPFIAY